VAGERVEVLTETEGPTAWRFETLVYGTGDDVASVCLTLSFADYNAWSADGAEPPFRVAEQVLAYFVACTGFDELPARVDASTIRRRFPGIDDRFG
jgi:hypothetical protein